MVFFMIPDSVRHNPEPSYIRELLDLANINQRQASRVLGIPPRMMRYYTTTNGPECPYSVQYCLEQLASAELSSAE